MFPNEVTKKIHTESLEKSRSWRKIAPSLNTKRCQSYPIFFYSLLGSCSMPEGTYEDNWDLSQPNFCKQVSLIYYLFRRTKFAKVRTVKFGHFLWICSEWSQMTFKPFRRACAKLWTKKYESRPCLGIFLLNGKSSFFFT